MNKNLNIKLNPDIFLCAAELMFLGGVGSHCGCCMAIRQSGHENGLALNYDSDYHNFFNLFFPWNSDEIGINGEKITHQITRNNCFGTYNEENRPHRIFALLLCHELCKKNNKRLAANKKRRKLKLNIKNK